MEGGNDGGRAAGTHAAYWQKNVRILLGLLVVWFVASYGFGIIWAEGLDRIRIPGTGFPLGFWFAQQGSIYVFVLLIFFYVWRMNRLDDEYGVAERPMAPGDPSPGSRPSGMTAPPYEPPVSPNEGKPPESGEDVDLLGGAP